MNDESQFTIHEPQDTRYGKNLFLGSIAAWLMSLFGKTPHKHTTDDLRRKDFKTSTQHLGIRFTDKIRDVFRFKWLKLKEDDVKRRL